MVVKDLTFLRCPPSFFFFFLILVLERLVGKCLLPVLQLQQCTAGSTGSEVPELRSGHSLHMTFWKFGIVHPPKPWHQQLFGGINAKKSQWRKHTLAKSLNGARSAAWGRSNINLHYSNLVDAGGASLRLMLYCLRHSETQPVLDIWRIQSLPAPVHLC